MSAGRFISSRLRFEGKLATVAIAVSFIVIIVSLAVSAGYRESIRDGVSALTGDIQLTRPDMNWYSPESPVHADPPCRPSVESIPGVKGIVPVIYRGGIVKKDDDIRGVLFKGVPSADSAALRVVVPESLAISLDLKEGDEMLTYFVGERLQARKFTVAGTYPTLVTSADNLIVMASLEDMRRLNGWDEGEVSALEIMLEDGSRDVASQRRIAMRAASVANGMCGLDDRNPTLALPSADRYSQLFDWLSLIDFNVKIILALMILVAGFNMISALLILLFRNIPTIGTLKSLGMRDRGVSGVFLRLAARTVLKGMLAGNLLAAAFCLLQRGTHFLKLDPSNYFVNYVPVKLELVSVLCVDAIAFAAIMLLMLLPSLFISRVDPADTMRVR